MSERSNPKRLGRGRSAARSTAVPALLAVLCLAGCAGSERFPTGAITVTVKPGDTGKCVLSPCRILLEMPPGEGDYRVTGNQIDLGTYPAGKTANLGDFYAPQAIEIRGAEVPRAFVYIPITP